MRDHRDGRRVRWPDPGRAVRGDRRRLDRSRHRRDAAHHRSRAVLMQNHGPVHDRVDAAGRGQGRRHVRGRCPNRAPREAGGPLIPIRRTVDALYDRYQNVYGQADDHREMARETEAAATRSPGRASSASSWARPASRPAWSATTRSTCWRAAATSGRTGSSTASGPTPSTRSGRACRLRYADLVADVRRRYGCPRARRAIGVSAMMHGYLAFDAAGELLVPFRTWRNTTTGRPPPSSPISSGSTSRCAGRSRTCIRRCSTTSRTSPRSASSPRSPATCTGSSPVATCSASATRRACSRSTPGRRLRRRTAARYEGLVATALPGGLELLPEMLVAGRAAGDVDRRGGRAARPDAGRCVPASRSARPRGMPEQEWSRRTRSRRAPAT